MNVLLCLLSNQHVPNLLSVHHFCPDKLVLVESAGMKKRNVAANFLNALKLGGLDYDAPRSDIEPLLTEDSLESVRATLRQAYGKYPSGSWIANLTGGTKPMSIATYEFFKALQGRLVYTNVARPAELLDIATQQTETCQHRLTVREFLAGYGFESRKAEKKIQEAESRAERWWECARLIAEHATSDDLLQLSDDNRKKARDKGWTVHSGENRFPNEKVAESIAKTFELKADGQGYAGTVSKHGAEFMTGGWLEVFFWGLVSRQAKSLNLWDVRLGMEVGRVGDTSGNDFDVAFMRNYGLEMIECKSGNQSQDLGGEVLYKVEAVTRQFRAVRVRPYLATTGTNVLDKEGKVKSTLQNRADIYGCRILTTGQLHELARNAEKPEIVRQVLFGESR